MSKILKRIGTKPIRYKIEFVLKEFNINLVSKNSCKVSVMLVRGKQIC